MARYDEIGLNALLQSRVQSRIGQETVTPWPGYAGTGWYTVTGPAEGLTLVVRDNFVDADGFQHSTKVKLMPGARVQIVNAPPGSEPGRAYLSAFATNGQPQQIGSNQMGYIRLDSKKYQGRSWLIRQGATVTGQQFPEQGVIRTADVSARRAIESRYFRPSTDPRYQGLQYYPGLRAETARGRLEQWLGYTGPGWYRLQSPKTIYLHARAGDVTVLTKRLVPAGTMIEVDQTRNILPATPSESSRPILRTNWAFISRFVENNRLYSVDSDTVAYIRTECFKRRGLAAGPVLIRVPEFNPNLVPLLGEVRKSALQRAGIPIATAPTTPLGSLDQARRGAIPIAPPVQQVATSPVFTPVPQNGLSTSRLTRFSGVTFGRNTMSLNTTTALGLQSLLQPQVRRDLLAPNAAVAPRAMMVGQDPALSAFWQVAIPVSAGLSGYHGYKRNNDSLGWGLVWGLLGATFPIVTPAVAYAQGFGTRAR